MWLRRDRLPEANARMKREDDMLKEVKRLTADVNQLRIKMEKQSG